jgi:hypothetical protein
MKALTLVALLLFSSSVHAADVPLADIFHLRHGEADNIVPASTKRCGGFEGGVSERSEGLSIAAFTEAPRSFSSATPPNRLRLMI